MWCRKFFVDFWGLGIEYSLLRVIFSSSSSMWFVFIYIHYLEL